MLERKIKPIGVAVVMDADHFCMQWRGVKDRDSKMINSVMRGAFLKVDEWRREFLALVEKISVKTFIKNRLQSLDILIL
jgi:GTP cyclohydrolase I